MSNQPGWKLLPVMHDGKAPCTHEMADAFDTAYEAHSKKHGFYESMNAGYNAMVAVSPTPPASLHLTDKQMRSLRKATEILCATGYHDDTAVINNLLSGVSDQP